LMQIDKGIFTFIAKNVFKIWWKIIGIKFPRIVMETVSRNLRIQERVISFTMIFLL
jgi:hypothetical protein